MNPKIIRIAAPALGLLAVPTIWLNLPESRAKLSKAEAQFAAWQAEARKTIVSCDLPIQDQPENGDAPVPMGLSVVFYAPFEGDISSLGSDHQKLVNQNQNRAVFYFGEIGGRDKREISPAQADKLLSHDWQQLIQAAKQAQASNPNAISPDIIKEAIPKSTGMISPGIKGYHLAFVRLRNERIL